MEVILMFAISMLGTMLFMMFVALLNTRLARRKNTKIVDSLNRVNKERLLSWAKDLGLLKATDDEIQNQPTYFSPTGPYNNACSRIRIRALIGIETFSIFYKIDPEDLAAILSSLAHLLPNFQVDIAGQLCDHYKPRQLEKILEEMSFRHHEAAKAVSWLVEEELQRRKNRQQEEKDEKILKIK